MPESRPPQASPPAPHAGVLRSEDRERPQTRRGPNAAAYGANSFLAVINIITRSPSDTHGVELRGTEGLRGDDGFGHYYGSIGSRTGPLDWRLSVNQRRSDGFDFRYRRDESGSRTDQVRDSRDGYNTVTINYSGELALSPTDRLALETGYHELDEEGDPAEYHGFNPLTNPDITGEDWHGSLTWHHEPSPDRFFHLQVYHQTRDRRRGWRAFIDDPLADQLGVPPFETDLNEDLEEARTHIEFQQTNVFTPSTQLVFGASYREDRYESDTFFNGSGETNRSRVFANLEHQLTPWMTTNLGGMWEHDSLGALSSHPVVRPMSISATTRRCVLSSPVPTVCRIRLKANRTGSIGERMSHRRSCARFSRDRGAAPA